jgi:beta-1,4-mannosyl-glycoprotein beta-1,4-N-acetylglucosaminyltransferase
MRIIDNFLFSNEYDVLELKLETMYDYVDEFIVVESDATFTNLTKEYNFEKNKERYSRWLDKITYIKVSSPKHTNAWDNEFWSRDQFKLGWNNIQSGDILIISDCDEIIRPETLEFIRNSDYNYYGLMAPIFNFKANYLNTENEYTVWPVAYRYKEGINYIPSLMRRTANEQFIFRNRTDKSILVHHAAWHFSSYGNNEFIKNKLQSFSHTELNIPKYVDNIDVDKFIEESNNHINQNSGKWKKVILDNYFPKPILNNKEKYKDYICGDGDHSVTHYYNYGILQVEH